MIKIRTNFWMKPIPFRQFDWSAVYDDYEGGDGYDEPAGPIGFGRTEAEAVVDLIENAPPNSVRDLKMKCDEQTEMVARALCAHEKNNPDAVVPGRTCSFYGVGGSIKAAAWEASPHPLWWHFVSAANVAIVASKLERGRAS